MRVPNELLKNVVTREWLERLKENRGSPSQRDRLVLGQDALFACAEIVLEEFKEPLLRDELAMRILATSIRAGTIVPGPHAPQHAREAVALADALIARLYPKVAVTPEEAVAMARGKEPSLVPCPFVQALAVKMEDVLRENDYKTGKWGSFEEIMEKLREEVQECEDEVDSGIYDLGDQNRIVGEAIDVMNVAGMLAAWFDRNIPDVNEGKPDA